MKKIILYQIVDEGKLIIKEDFTLIIQNMISQGWQPYGPPFSRQSYLCQCMVQYTPVS